MGEKIRGGIIAIVFFFSFAGSSYSVDASGTNAVQSICTGTIEVMPLGDSITVGKFSGIDTSDGADADDIGYRKDLWDLLDGDGHTVDFVGTNSNGITYPFSDPQHEGHNGWRDDQIADNIYDNPGGDNFLNQNPPDVILLHIGTNSLNNDPSDVEDILNEIDQYEGDTGSSVVVIVAKIINQVPYNNVVTQFNNNVQSMVQARADYGSELFLVDMEGGAGINYSIWPGDPAGDMIDNLHPYATGFTKMAGVWKAKLDEILAACDTNEPPVVTNPGTQSDSEGVSVSLQISASDPDTDPITYSAANLPDGLSINPSSGLISGTIGQTAAKNSPYNTQVSVSDGQPFGTTTISFTWNVSSVNVPPAIGNIPTQNNAENDVISLQVNATDDDEDTLTFTAGGLPPDLSIDPNSGLISGTINYEASNGSPYSVTVTIQDDGDPQMDDTFNFTWNVSNTNRAPVLNTPANQHDDEGTTIDPPILITASDPDGDNISFEAINLPPDLSITQVTATSAEISGTITYDASKGQPSYEYDVQIIVTDDANPSLSDQKNMRWIVDDVNAAPDVEVPADQTNDEGDEVSLQIVASDPQDQEMTYVATGLPVDLTIDDTSGEISGTIAYTASPNSPYDVTVTVTDTDDNATNLDFTWTVNRVNQPPEVTDPGDQSDVEVAVVSLQIVATDPNDDPLTYGATNLPDGLSIDTSTGEINGTIDAGASDFSPFNVTVSVDDGEAPPVEVSFDWTVVRDNSSPDITNPGDQTNTEGDNVNLQIVATDSDGNTLTYSATDLPPGLSINTSTGLISGVIDSDASDSSPYDVTVTVDDGIAAPVQVMFKWTVASSMNSIYLPIIIR